MHWHAGRERLDARPDDLPIGDLSNSLFGRGGAEKGREPGLTVRYARRVRRALCVIFPNAEPVKS